MLKSNAAALAQRNYQRAVRLRRETRDAIAGSRAVIIRQAQMLSIGGYSSAYLSAVRRTRGAGLYSKRSPAPPLPPYVTNYQTGDLYRGWNVRIIWIGEDARVEIGNSAPEAKYIFVKDGAGNMIPRPILDEVSKFARRSVGLRIANARRRVLGA